LKGKLKATASIEQLVTVDFNSNFRSFLLLRNGK